MKKLILLIIFLTSTVLSFTFILKLDIPSVKRILETSYFFEVSNESHKELSIDEENLLIERLNKRMVKLEEVKGVEFDYTKTGTLVLSDLNLFQILKINKILEKTSLNLEKTIFAQNNIEFQLMNEDQSLTKTKLNGNYLDEVQFTRDILGNPLINFIFNDGGAKLLEEITRKNSGIYRPLVITVDGEIRWAPIIEKTVSSGIVCIFIGSNAYPVDEPIYTNLITSIEYVPFLNTKPLPVKLKLIKSPNLNKLRIVSLVLGLFITFIIGKKFD